MPRRARPPYSSCLRIGRQGLRPIRQGPGLPQSRGPAAMELPCLRPRPARRRSTARAGPASLSRTAACSSPRPTARSPPGPRSRRRYTALSDRLSARRRREARPRRMPPRRQALSRRARRRHKEPLSLRGRTLSLALDGTVLFGLDASGEAFAITAGGKV